MILAMRHKLAASLIIVVALAGCAAPPEPLAEAIPTRLSATEMRRIVEKFAADKLLQISGIAFLNDSLFVGTNVGLILVEENKAEALHRWYKTYNVISGPWHGANRSQLWMLRVDDRHLVQFDGKAWRRVEPPTPPNGFFGRGEFLEGFEGEDRNFYIVGAENSWHWNDSGDWILNPFPSPATQFSGVVGLAELKDRLLYVVHVGNCALSSDCDFSVYWNDDGKWLPPVSIPIRTVVQVLSASNAVFILGANGELVRIVGQEAVVIPTPGRCEAITRTTAGELLGSFTNEGIYRLDQENRWLKLQDTPYPKSEGEHRAYLAESHGVIAFATASVPQLVSGTSDVFKSSGSDALWLTDGGAFRHVDLVK
jgi:hypothetical protein